LLTQEITELLFKMQPLLGHPPLDACSYFLMQ
jgi:hypothetical protein